MSKMWPFSISVFFKQAAASPTEGRKLAASTITYPSISTHLQSIQTILRIDGLVGVVPTTFLIDSGASISAIKEQILPPNIEVVGRQPSTNIVGANGSPIDVVGQLDISVSVTSEFSTMHTFMVVKDLNVDCLLGSDFLMKHGAIINYADQVLTLGKDKPINVPLNQSLPVLPLPLATVVLPKNITVAPRTVQTLSAILDTKYPSLTVGLVEPLDMSQQYLMLARSLSPI